MRTASIAVMSVLVSLVLVGTIAYGTGWFGFASASSTSDYRGQTLSVQNQEEGQGETTQAWLGILAVNNNQELADHLGLPTVEGVVVVRVIVHEETGLHRGDLITALDTTTITILEDLRSLLAKKSPEDVVTITYIREGTTATTQVTLKDRPLGLAHHLPDTLGHPPTPQLPRLAHLAVRFLSGQPLERLVTSSTVFERDDGAVVTVNAIGGTVAAIQPATDTTLATVTVEPKDNSPSKSIALGDGVLLLKRLHPVDPANLDLNDQVILVKVLVDGELQQTVVLVGTVVFGPTGRRWHAPLRPRWQQPLRGIADSGFQLPPGLDGLRERFSRLVPPRELPQGYFLT